MRYHFKIHHEKSGHWAECLELSGCFAQGDTKEELDFNMKEALNLYLKEPENSKITQPLPDSSIRRRKNIVEVQVDPAVALAIEIRRQRLALGLTQREMANRLDMKDIYSYQRLERRCNPSFSMIIRLKNEFPCLSIDKVLG